MLSGELENGTSPQILVKCNIPPPASGSVSLDQMVQFDNMEVRQTWRKTNGEIPEAVVVVDLVHIELAGNFNQPGKRKLKCEESKMHMWHDFDGHEAFWPELERTREIIQSEL